ncbi:MAG: aminotransferase class I/II-fold pyridoxal phosphate-dependent enzyme [Lutibacter sp.]|jgi:O-succinylhomoserine sulfhydrylase|nr:aminotransferase class I/II-fold pyridoxal phosphate-dependent enzyme [Lutibacter sp.]
MKNNKSIETNAIRNHLERSQFQEHSTPLYLSSSFVFQDAGSMADAFEENTTNTNIYSRFSNPNTSEFVQKIAAMEGAEDGYAFATGMAAIFSTFAALLQSGDHVLSARNVFGSTHTLFTKYLPKWQINTDYFDIDKPDTIADLIQPTTKIIYAETPTNPGVDVLDLEHLGKIARAHQVLLIIDNCFATPYIQQPLRYGADLVVHSATKLIDGQGRVLGGVVVGKKTLIADIYAFSRNSGPALSPFNAWILSKSLETLAVRVEKHCDNALKLAQYLEEHPKIARVKYPFLPTHPQYAVARKQMTLGGTIVAVELKGGLASGRRFLDAIKMCSLTANLGDAKTIVTHPASTTHSKLDKQELSASGISPGLVRISVGLEHITDIIQDIDQALYS